MPKCVRMYVIGSVETEMEVCGKMGTGLLVRVMFLE